MAKEIVMTVDMIANAILGAELNLDELRRLASVLNYKNKERQTRAAAAFAVGDKVTFMDTKRSHRVMGTINKINPKTVVVLSTDRIVWKVSPSLLKKVHSF